MAEQDARLETAIRNGLSRVDTSSAAARQAVYSAAIRSFDRKIGGRLDSDRAQLLRDQLITTIESIEDEYITPMLVDELDALGTDESDVSLPVAGHEQLARSAIQRPTRRLRVLVLAVVAGLITAVLYLASIGWIGTSTDVQLAYEAEPPYPLVHSESFETVLNQAAKFVTVTNKVARTPESHPLPSLVLPSELEDRFSGKTVEVTISARATAGATAAQLEAIYYTLGVGNSGQSSFPLTAEYSDVSFTYDVPARVGEPGEDYLGVAPASPDANASIDVRSIRIRLKPAS